LNNNTRKFLIKITDKWPVKVLSVAAALILSIFYRINTLESRFISLPLRVESNEYLVPASPFPQVVRVTLRGEPNSINPILEDDIETYIDLRRYTNEGMYRIPVQIRRKGSALGIEPLEISIDPIEITVRLENKVSRHINVSPVFRGTVAAGFELTSQSIIPTSVIADGPRSSMEMLYEFNTRTIDLEGRYEDFSVMVNIINDDPLIIIYGSRMIEYHGTIRQIVREITEEPVFRHDDIFYDEQETGADLQ
jgi:YbbR domain-containing protein